MSRKERLAKLRRERDRVEKRLAEDIAKLEKVEQRQHRKEIKEPEGEAERERIEAQLRQLAREAQRLEDEIDSLRPRARKLGRRIKRLARKIRNSVRPKVVDLRFPGASSPMGSVRGSVGHYTAGALATTDEQAVRLWHAVHAQHRAQGWAMIGYHIGLGPEGGVYLLRPLRFSGAHTAGFNTGYVGFSVHGTTGHTWTKPQLRAYRFALKKFGLLNKPVWGHNDLNATACPGSFKAGYVNKGS